MKISPKVPKKLAVIEQALDSGKYLICPEADPEHPRIYEPQHSPSRDDQVAKWVPSQFSYQMPDGGTFFCDLLQNGDSSQAWSIHETQPVTEDDF